MTKSNLIGKEIVLSPFQGDSVFTADLEGRIVDVIVREGLQKDLEYYIVKLRNALECKHPELKGILVIDQVLVLPDDTRLEWAFFGGGPEGLPVLVKVFGVIPKPGTKSLDYRKGEKFLLARAAAKQSSHE